MSETWHISGLAVKQGDIDYARPRLVRDQDGDRIAEVWAWGSSGERDARANQIAAVPELIRACEVTCVALNAYGDLDKRLMIALKQSQDALTTAFPITGGNEAKGGGAT